MPDDGAKITMSRPASRRVAAVGAALVAAWLVPALAHLAHLDVVLPVIVWLVTASLLRGHRTTVVDRLVIAFAALVSAVCVAGLIFAVWPAHLSPVPVAGTALSALALIGAATSRRPRLPARNFAWRDTPVVMIAGLAAVVGWGPVAGKDLTDRLAVVLSGEDLTRHFMIFDWMGRLGGYLFQTGEIGGRFDQGFVVYPQGSHLVAALLQRFRHPSGTVDAYTSLHDYVDYTLGAYLFFAVAVAWAISWLWAGRLRPAWTVVTYVVTATVVCFGGYLTMITRGYPSQLTGLALLMVLVALAARSLDDADRISREQVLLLAALFAALSFVYYFYLPLAAVAVAAWAWPRRRGLRGHPAFAAVTAVAALCLAAVMPAVNQANNNLSVLTYGGPAVSPQVGWLAVLTLLGGVVVAGSGRPRTWTLWTDPVRRTLLLVIVGAGLFTVALLVARFALGAGVVYYVKKALYALLAIGLLLLGGLGSTAAGATRTALTSSGRLDWVKRLPRWSAPVAAVAVALLILGGARVLDPRPAEGSLIFLPVPAAGSNYGRAFAEGRLAVPEQAAAVVQAAERQPEAPAGRLIIFWDAYGRGWDFYLAQWANVLDRRLDHGALVTMVEIPKDRPAGDELEKLLTSLRPGAPTARPVEVVTREDATVARVAAFRAAHPDADVTVLRLPGDCGAKCLK
jgi:hypothetical protein